MENVKILEGLFDNKKLAVLRLFLQNKERQFYLREIAKETKVPIATTFRIIGRLVKLELVSQLKINKFKLYKIAENENIVFLEGFLKEGKRIVQQFADKVKLLSGVEEIILHGDETEEKANILLIGEDVDANELKRICAAIKEQYKFTISSLTLTREQFSQMSNMGLYSGRKKVLFRKP